MVRRFLVFGALAALVTAAFVGLSRESARPPTPPPAPRPPIVELPPPPPEMHEVVHTIARGDTIGAVLGRYGAPPSEVRTVAKPIHDLAKLREGRDLTFVYRESDTVPVEIRYALDEERDRTLVVARNSTGWTASVDSLPYERRPSVRELVVRSSLWDAGVEAGLRPADIVALAAVFEYDIDMNTEVLPGATARMVLDELWLDGHFVKLGAPAAARFTNGGRSWVAIRYAPADGAEPGYFGADGVARKGAFLRSPLAFSTVTSGFSLNRYHPILGTSRPHYGVDFGAPTGTPVRAVGDGVVTFAGWSGGHGRFVKIDHPGPYETSYSHLSRVSVKNGQKVAQGQTIGHVGSTGLATGPHLHYQLWVHGKYTNPMTADLPREVKLPAGELGAFAAVRDAALEALDAPPPVADGAEP